MNRKRRQELERRTREAFEHLEASAEELASLASEGPRTGGLYLLRDGLEDGIEWAVLEQLPGRLRVVPADTVPLVGSADLPVTASEVGPLILRCGLGTWIEAPDSLGAPTGLLVEADLKVALQKSELLASGRPANPPQRAVDREPDYQEWMETVAAAREALILRLGGADRRSPEGRSSRLENRSRRSLWALAASLLLVANLALLLALGQQRGKNAQLSERLADLEGRAAAPLVDLPVAWLLGDQPRDLESPVRIPAGVPWLVVILRAPQAAAGAQYGIELRRHGRREPLWQAEGLRASDNGEITLALPTHLLTDGRHTLELVSRDGPAASTLYGLAIELEGR